MCAKILSTLDPDSATNTRFARLVYRLRLSSPPPAAQTKRRQMLRISAKCLWAVEDLPTNNFPDGKFSQAAPRDFCLCYAKQKYRCDLRVLTQAKQFACSPSSLPNSLWAVEDSNLRPFARQANALPTELTARIEFLDTTLKKEKSKDFLPSRFPSSEQVVRNREI